MFFVAHAHETKHVFEIIRHFPNITELNISAYGSDQHLRTILTDHPDFKTILRDSLSTLSNLKRLRLNSLQLSSNIRLLLDAIPSPLEHLNLTSCRLNSDDLEYLAESRHVSSIRNLILSNDDLESNVPLVRNLLCKLIFNHKSILHKFNLILFSF